MQWQSTAREKLLAIDIPSKGLTSTTDKELTRLDNKKQTTRSQHGQRTRVDIFPKKTQMSSSPGKEAQHRSASGNAIQTTMRYYLTPVAMAGIKETRHSKCWEEPSRAVGGNTGRLGQLLWETVWTFLRKLKVELPYDPATQRLSLNLPKLKRHKHLRVPSSTVYNSRDMEAATVHR